MPNLWKNEPTAAAQVIHRAMEERGWKQQDVAQETGLDAPNVSRWARGAVNPPDHRVAEIAAALGYDPRDFGINSPHALAKAARSSAIQPLRDDEQPPAWWPNQADTLHAKLDAVLANQDRIMQSLERMAR